MNGFISVALALTCPNGADSTGACILTDTLEGGAKDLLGLIDTITNWLFTILLVLAVTFVILATYKYLMSGGGEEVSKAHKMLLYAAVAVAVAVLAKGVVNVTKVLIGGSAGESGETNQTTNSDDNWEEIGTSPNNVNVWPCPDGSISAVRVDNNDYLDAEEADFVGVHVSNPRVSVERCSDGSVPKVMVDENIYSSPSRSNGTNTNSNQQSTNNTVNNQQNTYVAPIATTTNKPRPQFKIAPCNIDGKTMTIKIDGVKYPGANDAGMTTLSSGQIDNNFYGPYIRQSDKVDDHRVKGTTCSNGYWPGYIDVDGVRYIVSPSVALPPGE